MNDQERTLQFMAIAMKYLPEAKQQLDQAGIEMSMDMIQPFMDLFTKVMQDAYDLGRKDAFNEVEQKL